MLIDKSKIKTNSYLGQMLRASTSEKDICTAIVEQYQDNQLTMFATVGKENLIIAHQIYLNEAFNRR